MGGGWADNDGESGAGVATGEARDQFPGSPGVEIVAAFASSAVTSFPTFRRVPPKGSAHWSCASLQGAQSHVPPPYLPPHATARTSARYETGTSRPSRLIHV